MSESAHPPSIVHVCPRCGEGGLEVARIRSSPAVEAVVCAECDTVWLAPRKVGFQFNGLVSEVFPALGVEANWSSIETLAEGVPWDRIDAKYQSILTRSSRLPS